MLLMMRLMPCFISGAEKFSSRPNRKCPRRRYDRVCAAWAGLRGDDRLHFDQQNGFDDEIGAVRNAQGFAVVLREYWHLACERQPSFPTFDFKRGQIRRLEKPRPEHLVNGNGCVHDLRGKLIFTHSLGALCVPSRSLRSKKEVASSTAADQSAPCTKPRNPYTVRAPA